MASSDPGKVGIMLSSFCLRDATAVKSPRTEGWRQMSGWTSTARRRGCGYDANWDKIDVTSIFVAKEFVGINSTCSNSKSRKVPRLQIELSTSSVLT